MAFDFEEWYNNLTKYDTIFKYSGEITSEIVTKTLDDAEAILFEYGLDKKKVKRAYNATVEALQNLFHHSITKPDGEQYNKFGAFCFRLHHDNLDIITGNYVMFDIVPILRDRMNQINLLDEDEVKELYKKILSNEEFSDKGGGGLGMVDIAKRTGSKLQYAFFEFDEKYSFFELKVNV
ncbi:MAG: SiaB family protein kinase [Bacteroidales bacterium]|nr:SiaB family protein kinase [Bacteroidales bacterium]